MDKRDKQISTVLQALWDHYHGSNNLYEQHGMISRGAFFTAAGRYLENATDNRTRETLWRVAHERDYLQPAQPTVTFSGLVTGLDKSYVRSDIWAHGGKIEMPAMEELSDILSRPARARS